MRIKRSVNQTKLANYDVKYEQTNVPSCFRFKEPIIVTEDAYLGFKEHYILRETKNIHFADIKYKGKYYTCE